MTDYESYYGYENEAAAPAVDYGYGDEPVVEEPKQHRPRRRCSVTKFSLVSSEDSQEAEMARQLHSVDIINQLRSGGIQQSIPTKDDMTATTEVASDWSTDDDQSNKKNEKSKKKATRQKSRSRRS